MDCAKGVAAAKGLGAQDAVGAVCTKFDYERVNGMDAKGSRSADADIHERS